MEGLFFLVIFVNLIIRSMITGEAKVLPNENRMKYDPEPKVLLIDADSIVYHANYGAEDDIELAKFRVGEKLQGIIIECSEYFKFVRTLVFIKGENNFRYNVATDYKSNRPEKHPNIPILYEYMKQNYDVICSDNAEADDYIYTAWKMANEQAVIATTDKDLKSGCHGNFYDYRKNQFSFVSEEEMIYNFRIQMLIGDSGDHVNPCKGFGIKRAQKVVSKGMSTTAFMKELIKVYRKYHGDNYKKVATDTYNLLKLHHVEQLETLTLKYGRN